MVRYHPVLFGLISIIALVELGLTAHLINVFESAHAYPSDRYRSLIDFLLFNSCWTFLFGGAYILFILRGSLHLLGSIASSAIWLIITAILWLVSAAMYRDVRGGGTCEGAGTLSHCSETLAVEALAWVEFVLCLVTLFAACCWMRTGNRSYRDSYYV